MDPNAVDEFCSSSGASARPEGEKEVDRAEHGGTDDPWLLDFSTNVNPETPDGIAGIYESALAAAQSYPADDYSAFRANAARYVGCEATEIIPTAGGLAAIRLAIATTVTPGDAVLVPYPGFSEYAREVRLQGGHPTFVPYDEITDADPSEFQLVIVCTPNNPTGDAYAPEQLCAFADRCREAGTPLLADEAFLDFTDLPSLAGQNGVIVVRSLTKLFGLPGLRAGFAVATGQYRERLDTTRLTWGLDTPTAIVGTYCLQQSAFIEETKARVREERSRMRTRLSERFDVSPSDSPFLLLELDEGDDVDSLLSTLRADDITVRDARTFRGLDNHIRVAVRLPAENDRLLDALGV
jgi:histidinol-phosphate aminotransferase/threonine-phosphate decarboxylase